MSKGDPTTNDPETGEPVELRAGVRNLLVGNKEAEANREFGMLLRSLRVRAKLSAAAVADAAGVSASFVRSIERGDQAPSEVTADAILSALGLPVDEFPVELTSPDSGQEYRIAFMASSKGDNSRWSLARLVRGETEKDTLYRLARLVAESPIGDELQRKRERKQLRALGVYGVPEDEPPAETLNRIYRRIGAATDEEVLKIHRFLDSVGVDDPKDPQEDYHAEAYDSRWDLTEDEFLEYERMLGFPLERPVRGQ